MKPHKIIEEVFKEEFGDDWGSELRDFEHGFSEYYDCSIKAIRKAVSVLPDMDLEEAEKLSMKCDYAHDACEVEGNEINTGDAAAFFLEGYLEARNRLKSNER